MKSITDLDELKKIELSIMLKVHDFCKAAEIPYFLAYGTLIGAVRHNGFIPWDDDIDIHMMRKDYDHFCTVFPDYAKECGLAVVNSHTNTYYGRDMAKVIDTRTIIYENDFKGDDPIGVFVDIWPLDSLPNEERERNRFIFKDLFLQKLYYLAISNPAKLPFYKRILRSLPQLVGSKRLLAMTEKYHQSYSDVNTEFVGCLSDPYLKVFPKSLFDRAISLQFENALLDAPVGFDEVLKILYGDYMQLPPVEKRVPHHVIETYWKDQIDG